MNSIMLATHTNVKGLFCLMYSVHCKFYFNIIEYVTIMYIRFQNKFFCMAGVQPFKRPISLPHIDEPQKLNKLSMINVLKCIQMFQGFIMILPDHNNKMQVNINRKKVDVAFYNSLTQVKNYLKYRIALHSIETITMGIMIPINLLVIKQYEDQILSFFCLALAISFFGFLGNLRHLLFLNDKWIALNIAKEVNHTVDDEPLHENDQGWVSDTIYNAQNLLTINQANQQMRRIVESQLIGLIRVIGLSFDPCNRLLINFTGGGSFALFIYGVVLLFTSSLTVAEYIVISIYVFFEFIAHFQIFICLLIMALIPLLCIIFIIYACFCHKEKRVNLPPSVPATIEILNQTDGADCSICFQAMILDEQVIILPCSEKHVFHDKCIMSWTTVKSNCPICRHDLAQ